MKKTVLILTFLVCVINYYGFAFPKRDPDPQIPGGSSTMDKEIAKIDGELKSISGKITKLEGDVTGISGRLTKLEGDVTSISGRLTKLESGGGSPGPNPSPVISSRIPITPKIVQFILQNVGSSDGLKFYISKKFYLEIYEQKETAEIEINKDKVIINPVSTPNAPTEIEFSVDSEGVLDDIPGPDKGRELQILFQQQGKNFKLVFRRNAQQNGYELFSVNNIYKNYKIRASEPIQLYVAGEDRRKVEVQAVSSDSAFNTNQPSFDVSYNDTQLYQNRNIGGYSDIYSYNVFISSRNVMGTGSLNPKSVIAYAKSKNPALNGGDIAIINEYFNQAGIEGVNVDIAIAQMLYWTNYLKQNKATCNYGGLSRINGWNGRFPYKMRDGMLEGVRAHIQHLKGYAKEIPVQNIVDPRYRVAYERGFRGINFEQVCGKWSENPGYGQKIENILRELYRISGVL